MVEGPARSIRWVARSAVRKSPATNSPVSSMKKQRSASPSKAMPRSAAVLADLADDELAVLGQQRVGLVVGEAPVEVEEVRHRVDRQAIEHRGQVEARHPVGGVQDHAQVADGRRGPRSPGTRSTNLSSRLSSRLRLPGVAASGGPARAMRPTSPMPASPESGSAPAVTIFMPVYCGRVVARGDAGAGVEAAVGDREVEHLGGAEPQLDDVGSRGERALGEAGGDRGRGEAHVVAHGDPLGAGQRDEGGADPLGARPRRPPRGRGRGRRRP